MASYELVFIESSLQDSNLRPSVPKALDQQIAVVDQTNKCCLTSFSGKTYRNESQNPSQIQHYMAKL